MENVLSRRPSRLTLKRGLAIAAGIAGLGFVLAIGARTAWYHIQLGRAERELAGRQFASARARLANLSSHWPGRAEIEYPLGSCEAALGHVDAALAAWSRVPLGSPSAHQAALDAARLAVENGRLAAAEERLAATVNAPAAIRQEAAILRERLLFLSGRWEQAARSIEQRWDSARDQAKLLWTHWQLETQPLPVDSMRDSLEQFSRLAPDDDRVWLGRADLATRTGRFTEADGWLNRCERRRPEDPDVWRARLHWALSSGNPGAAASAMTHLHAGAFSKAETAALAVRFAALRGDSKSERAALEDCITVEPGDGESWGRLAELAARAGAHERAAECRRRKAAVDQAHDRYRKLMDDLNSTESLPAPELATAAESQGRRFEARGWWTLHALRFPDDPHAREALERLKVTGAPATTDGRSLADVIPGARNSPAVSSGIPPLANALPRFREDAGAAGLRFVYQNDQSPLRRLPETMGGGVGLLDYDGDGWLDVYAVQGGRFPDGGRDSVQGDRLFRNRRDGTFEDVTERAGIASLPRGFGHGVAVGDYDNDGRPDIFVTRWRSYALYRNQGDGTFRDLTEQAGLAGNRDWPTSAAFGDLDGDGDLDLYVCHYLDWDPGTSRPCVDPDRPGSYLYCIPRSFRGEPDHVFRNDGGRFVDVSAQAGIVDRDGRGLGVVIADLDDDGRLDIFVANDMTFNFLFRNLGNFHFEEVGESSGAGSSGEGGYQAGMGIACGDLDGDGRPDLAVTNFYGESTSLFLNLSGGLFAERSAASGLAAPTRHVLGFGASFLDANNDGWLDLAQVNGHVNDLRPGIPYLMPAQLFLGSPDGRFADASSNAGNCWDVPRVGRGLAAGDLDNDGRQDLVVLPQAGPLAFFHNQGTSDRAGVGGHFLTLRLEGTKSNRDAVGARVRVSAGGRTQTAQRLGGGSYLSAGDGRLHFGLGGGNEVPVADVEIRWPSGLTERHDHLKADTAYHLKEGESQTPRLRGWPEERP